MFFFFLSLCVVVTFLIFILPASFDFLIFDFIICMIADMVLFSQDTLELSKPDEMDITLFIPSNSE